MGIEALSEVDNTDDRREVMRLLSILDASQRITFMGKAVDSVNAAIRTTQPPPWMLWDYKPESGEVNEVYMDLFLLIAQFNLPVKAALEDLERFVSKAKPLWKP